MILYLAKCAKMLKETTFDFVPGYKQNLRTHLPFMSATAPFLYAWSRAWSHFQNGECIYHTIHGTGKSTYIYRMLPLQSQLNVGKYIAHIHGYTWIVWTFFL